MSNGVTTFDLPTHQRERIRQAEARNVMLEAEERRLHRILALALQVAAGDECKPAVLLAQLFILDGTDPGRPAWIEEKLADDITFIFTELAKRDLPHAQINQLLKPLTRLAA